MLGGPIPWGPLGVRPRCSARRCSCGGCLYFRKVEDGFADIISIPHSATDFPCVRIAAANHTRSVHVLAIRVEHLGKRYRVNHAGAARRAPATGRLREDLVAAGPAARRSVAAEPGSGRHGTEDFWALKDVDFEVQPGEVRRHHRPQRRRQIDAAEDPVAHHQADDRPGRAARPRRQPARSRHRLSSRADRPREHLSQRRHPRHDAAARSHRKFDEIVEFAEVERFLDTPVKRYSSGMYVRLAFAVAAHLEPEILIVDEVLAVGDMAFQRKCLGRMREVGRTGCTVLFVSHNMPAVESLCTRAILLDGGRVVHDGGVRELVQEYHRRVLNAHASTGAAVADFDAPGRALQGLSRRDPARRPRRADEPPAAGGHVPDAARRSTPPGRSPFPTITLGIDDTLGHRS